MAQRRPEAPALTTRGGCWSYGRLLAAALVVASRLRADPAFHPGDRVILLLPNSAEYAAAFYGILLAGGVVVPVPPKAEAGTLAQIAESTAAMGIVADPQVVRSRDDLKGLPLEVVDLSCRPEIAGPPGAPAAGPADNELAAIFFTAGSTGTPKGVMLSHHNFIANARSIQQYLRITDADRPLCVLPFHHAFGNSVWQSHLLAGAHLILDGHTAFPETIIQALAKHGCTSLSAVPDLFRMLLERSSLGEARLPSLRYMAVAGGALRHELVLDMSQRIAPAEFFVMYGQTEATARLAFVPPERLAGLPAGCIGRAVPEVTLEVVDEQGACLPPGAVGELRAKGPNVMLGYWRDAAATAERIRSGWLYTGDLAAVDESGWIVHKGRRNALVKIAGFRVHPADLEDFAVRRLAAGQAVAVAFEARDVGTRLALYLKPANAGGALTISELLARCRAELPRHMVPDLVQIVDEFPLNHALKIDRPLLSRLAEERSAHRRLGA